VVSQKRLQQREKLHTEAVLARIALGAVPHMGKDLAVRRAFKQALAKALGSLTLRERSLLGLRLDGLTLAELASAFDVQTCTVWRWLGRLNASVKNAILGELRKELRLNDEDLDSVVRSVLDRVDTSICRQVSRGVGAG
jgi:DNA-directed RNA polymerase specialized sigma24 family protein